MPKQIILEAKEITLQFEIAENGWCRVTLVKDEPVYLGADGIDSIKERFTAVLNETWFKERMAEFGEGWANVLNLAEAHASIYMRNQADDYVMLIQDLNAKTIDTVSVTRDEYARWVLIIQDPTQFH